MTCKYFTNQSCKTGTCSNSSIMERIPRWELTLNASRSNPSVIQIWPFEFPHLKRSKPKKQPESQTEDAQQKNLQRVPVCFGQGGQIRTWARGHDKESECFESP